MPRQKKDSQVVNIKLEKSIYDKFTEFCDKTGLTKTVVIERALKLYIDTMTENPEKLIER